MKTIQECLPGRFADLPEKVLQFGEGNFLRAFADWMIELSNRRGELNGSVVLCQPLARGAGGVLNAQNCRYTVVMRGLEGGEGVERVEQISSVSRCINPYEDYDALMEIARSEELRCVISNTTEAGIAYRAGDAPDDRPPQSYPAKLCAFLYERFSFFHGAGDRGLLILPVELIDDNGRCLRRIVLQYAREWALGERFERWLEESCCFASTLVDRIVTGYPAEQIEQLWGRLGYEDRALVTCELFNLWVIEADAKWKDVFPVGGGEANVVWTDDAAPYKKRKVRILNGAHTATAPAAWLAGHEFVRDFMEDARFEGYMNRMLEREVVPTLTDLPKEELLGFVRSVNDRFRNPFIRHRLLDISLNSCAKYRARCLPSLLAFQEQFKSPPPRLTFALAAFMRFYRGTWRDGAFCGAREDGQAYEIRDDREVLDFMAEAWKSGDAASVCRATLGNAALWGGRDLALVPGLVDAAAQHLDRILKTGVRAAMQGL